MPDNFPKVDVLVLLYKNAQFMRALFEGVAAQDYPREAWRLKFIDNNPGDGTLDEVKRLMQEYAGRLPEVVIREPGENLGFTGGNNILFRESAEEGVDYVYLLNGDAAFEIGALSAAVRVAEADEKIGAVQSLLVLQQNPDEINSWGNALHYLGFGYAYGYHKRRKEAPRNVVDIAYPSGAGVLLRVSAVARAGGLFQERFQAYHEDLDLGWRIWLAGYRCVMAPQSVVQHHYEFSRSIQKWFWMERNRWFVILMNYKIATLVWLAPQLIAAESALWVFAVAKGWWRDKLKVYGYFLKAETWRYIADQRKAVNGFRVRRDREILAMTSPTIAYQDVESWPVKALLNPIGKTLHWVTKMVVLW
ncbi:MAG: glycosyltransferase family 2 protein [Patescibacteria group bacterium]|nr:glycosyltransferase family 2 protein [Patescibacteria group bacterium]